MVLCAVCSPSFYVIYNSCEVFLLSVSFLLPWMIKKELEEEDHRMVILEADGSGWSLSRARVHYTGECCAPHCYYISRLFPDRFLDRRGLLCRAYLFRGEFRRRIPETKRHREIPRYLAGISFVEGHEKNVNKKSRVEAINKLVVKLCGVLSLST